MNYSSFEEFSYRNELNDEASSSVKYNEILNELNIPDRIYMRDDRRTTNCGIFQFKRTLWVLFVNDFDSDSHGSPPLVNVINENNSGIRSEYQRNDSYSVSYCLIVL